MKSARCAAQLPGADLISTTFWFYDFGQAACTLLPQFFHLWNGGEKQHNQLWVFNKIIHPKPLGQWLVHSKCSIILAISSTVSTIITTPIHSIISTIIYGMSTTSSSSNNHWVPDNWVTLTLNKSHHVAEKRLLFPHFIYLLIWLCWVLVAACRI